MRNGAAVRVQQYCRGVWCEEVLFTDGGVRVWNPSGEEGKWCTEVLVQEGVRVCVVRGIIREERQSKNEPFVHTQRRWGQLFHSLLRARQMGG